MMRRSTGALLVALTSTVALTACADEPSADTPLITSPPTTRLDVADELAVSVETSAPDGSGQVTGDAPAEIVEEVVRRVSAETGLPIDAISVESAIAKVWTDGSLGCAEPGLVRTQQEEAGFEIDLSADDRTWSYRVRQDGEMIVCDD